MERAAFFKHFELLSDTPNAVAKMRELVLDLAVQGKLVDQDPEDEPASKLLEQIKKQNRTAYHSVNDENAPYQAPANWIWVKLGFLAEIERGGSPRPIKDYITNDPDGLNWIKIGDTEKGGKFITSTQEKIRKEGLKKTRKVYPGDFLLTNSMSFGRPYISKIEGCIHDGWLRIHPPRQITSDYLYWLLSSPIVYEFFSKAAAGAVVQNLNADKVRELPIPLPPLAEQKRIVAKVEELMGLCDELAARQRAQREARARLTQSAFTHLTAAPDEKAFRHHAGFLLQHSAIAFDDVAQLRQTILQLAVQGRLVRQDPKDEPAPTALKTISNWRQKQFDDGTNSKVKSLPDLSLSERPSEMPHGWEWTRLGNVVVLKSGNTLPAALELPEGELPYLKVGDMNLPGNETTISTSSRFIKRRKEIERFVIPANSIIFPKRGGAIATNKKRLVRSEILVDSNTMAMLCPPAVDLSYLFVWFRTIDLWKLNSGTSVPQINNKDIDPLIIAVPPLAEQKRIVAKVGELLRLCDELETRLQQSRTHGEQLLAATIRQLLAA